MTRWTPDKITEARKYYARASQNILSITDDEARSLFALALIGFRVVDPSPEDVERVARALWSAAAIYPNADADWPRMAAADKKRYFRLARAALAAIFEDQGQNWRAEGK